MALAVVSYSRGFVQSPFFTGFDHGPDDIQAVELSTNAFVRILIRRQTAIVSDHLPTSCSSGEFEEDSVHAKKNHKAKKNERGCRGWK